MNDPLYGQLQRIDPLQVAEEITGEQVSRGSNARVNETDLLMLRIAMAKSAPLEVVLENEADVHSGLSAVEYIERVLSWGFEPVLLEPLVVDSRHGGDKRNETMYVLAHRKYGLVLRFDTYSYTKEDDEQVVGINSGNMWFSARSHDKDDPGFMGLQLSGGLESESHPLWRNEEGWYKDGKHTFPDDAFFHGYVDCRQGLYYTISEFMKRGDLLPVWPALRRPHLLVFISSYDWYDKEWPGHGAAGSKWLDDRNHERFERTPDWFKTIINSNIKADRGV
jgi:hypothetical protein